MVTPASDAKPTFWCSASPRLKMLGISSDEMSMRSTPTPCRMKLTLTDRKLEKEYTKRFIAYLRGDSNEVETRDLLAGQQTIFWTAGPAGGYLVPIDYEAQTFEALAQTDPIFDEDVTHFMMEKTPVLQPKQLQGYDLSSISASLIGETVQQTAGVVPTVAGRVFAAI